MAHSLSAKKRVRQNAERRAISRWRLRTMREAIKGFLNALATGTNEEAKSAYQKAAAIVDKTAQKGVIHRNQAARRKSRLNARLKSKVLA